MDMHGNRKPEWIVGMMQTGTCWGVWLGEGSTLTVIREFHRACVSGFLSAPVSSDISSFPICRYGEDSWPWVLVQGQRQEGDTGCTTCFCCWLKCKGAGLGV